MAAMSENTLGVTNGHAVAAPVPRDLCLRGGGAGADHVLGRVHPGLDPDSHCASGFRAASAHQQVVRDVKQGEAGDQPVLSGIGRLSASDGGFN